MGLDPTPQSEARLIRGLPSKPACFVLLICVTYGAVLWWIDRENGAFRRLARMAGPLALALLPVFASYLVRYWRWSYLLGLRGHRVPVGHGFNAYIAGFALTATPGKAGELLRIRYFARMGVPAQRTLAVFAFERASDLLVILLLSLLAASVFPSLGLLSIIVIVFVILLFGAVSWPVALAALSRLGRALPGRWLPRITGFAVNAAVELRDCLGPAQFGRSLLAGLLAWSLTSAVFVGLCCSLGLELDPVTTFGIYPLAMLVGALSFIPGGVGTTELAIVLMLGRLGVATPDAVAVAVGTRLVTLWFAIAVGALALLRLEFVPAKKHAGGPGIIAGPAMDSQAAHVDISRQDVR